MGNKRPRRNKENTEMVEADTGMSKEDVRSISVNSIDCVSLFGYYKTTLKGLGALLFDDEGAYVLLDCKYPGHSHTASPSPSPTTF
jgi:hypothetical protein